MPRPSSSTRPPTIPTNSLVASAVRYEGGKVARIYQTREEWQAECYRHYAICGEARFAARFMGHAMSRAVLGIGTPSPTGMIPKTEGSAVDRLKELFNGADGQAQMLEQIGVHLAVGGECYLVGRTVRPDGRRDGDPEDGVEVWEIVSVMEMQVNGRKWKIVYGNTGNDQIELTDKDVVIRIWLPDPAFRMKADSPFRALLPVLTEIEWLTRHIFAQCASRLAGAGLLFMPQGATFPPPVDAQGKALQVANEADAFMQTLARAMLTPIEDPSNPSSLVPIIVTVPDDVVDKAKLLHFWSNLDEHAMPLRQDAIRRFALGMDMPPEQVMGMSTGGTGGGRGGGPSHWGMWQIEESTIKMFVEPSLELVANAITVGYIRPLVEEDEGAATDDRVTYDTSALRLRPDRSKEATEMYDRGALSKAAMLRENGFPNKDDLMDDDEFKLWLLKKVALGSATPEQVQAALKVLGVVMPVSPAMLPDTQRETRPDPSLEDHPLPRHTPEAAAILPAAEALVFRALERAGNRIRQKVGVRPPGVKAFAMHTLYKVNGDASELLDDAWSSAPAVLEGHVEDPAVVIATLDAYCRSLFAEQAEHDRHRLQQWLEVST